MNKVSKNLKLGLLYGSICLVLIASIKILNFPPGFFFGIFVYVMLPTVTVIYLFLGLFNKFIWFPGIFLVGVGTCVGYVKSGAVDNTTLFILLITFLAGFGLIIISITKAIASRNV